MSHSPHFIAAALALFCISLSGCATSRPVAYSGLESATKLQPNPADKSGRIPYQYSARVDSVKYASVIIDPVAIYNGADNQFEKVSEEDKKVLAQYMNEQFQEKLAHRYRVVSEPSPEALRVKFTLTGAKTTPPVVGTFTHFDLAGGPYNVVQSVRGKEGLFMGSVTFAVEVYDSSTNRLLSAFVQKQYPNAMNVGSTLGALGAAKAGIRKGAEELPALVQ